MSQHRYTSTLAFLVSLAVPVAGCGSRTQVAPTPSPQHPVAQAPAAQAAPAQEADPLVGVWDWRVTGPQDLAFEGVLTVSRSDSGYVGRFAVSGMFESAARLTTSARDSVTLTVESTPQGPATMQGVVDGTRMSGVFLVSAGGGAFAFAATKRGS